MKFSLSTLLVAFLVIGAFFAGWILPPPNTDKSLTPVLIATRDLPYRTTLRDSDFRAVYMKIDNVPDLAARNLNQVED